MRARRLTLPILCLAALVTAGCDASSSGDPAMPSASATSSTTTGGSATASPSPSVTAFTTTCESALSLTAVSEAAGQPVIGRTAFVVGEADPSIGRLAYLNCRYGIPEAVPGASKAPSVEIGVSLYDSADRATARVASTVDDYTSTGSRAGEIPVGGVTGTVLTKLGDPATLVVADGTRTVAVSVNARVSAGNEQLVAIAALALEKAV